MVRKQIVRVRQLLTLHLGLLAFLTASLAAMGSESIFLPLLVLVVGCSSLLFVDWLEWFSLHHVLAYIGMILGTVFALIDYFWKSGVSSTSGQLYAIASLLIYPEIIIMLQRKNMRLFEQMAMFLLLEIIVAALLNDNVLFGTLLAPIVLLWVSALLLLARYKALINLAPDMDRPTPRLYEVVLEAWRRARRSSRGRPEAILSVSVSEETSQMPLGFGALLGQAAPLGIASLVFAGLYFYLLPRATLDNVAAFSGSPRTGLSDRVTLGAMGKLMQDHTPVLRLALRHARTGQPYRVHEPPYIRGNVVSHPHRQSRVVSIEAGSSEVRLPSDQLLSLAKLKWPTDLQGYDPVEAKFELLSVSGSTIPCIAPMIEGEMSSNFISVLPFEYRMINNRSDIFPVQSKTKYSLLTSAFLSGVEKPVLPDSRQVYSHPARNATEALLARLQTLEQSQYTVESTKWIEDLLAEVRQSHPSAVSEVALARAVEEFFSASGKFGYSLSLRTVPDAKLDPIEDFVVNQKRGNCEYYAAALMVVLRHLHIPTRMVLGYHPLEYNELGDYFTIRNSDAHAWVEAHFTAAQLREAGYYSEDMGAWGGWLRLDPTPAGAGSNAGSRLRTQANQVSDLAQTVWRDYFLNSRQRIEDSSLYGPLQASTRETYVQVVEWFRETIKRMQDSQFVGGAIDRKRWFSWPVALAIMLIGGGLVVLLRWLRLLPRLAPRLAKQLRWMVGGDGISQHFYRDCLRLLNRAGFARAKDQTPHEYTQAAGLQLASKRQWDSAPQELSVLTAAYYRLRFGGEQSLSVEEIQAVHTALSSVQQQLK